MLTRRRFLCTVSARLLAAPVVVEAQREGRAARIGFLVMARNPGVESAFPSGLAELGYTEGRDVIIQWVSAEGRNDQLAALAAEVVQWGAEVIVAGGPEARIAAMKATATIPIVVVGGANPVTGGWAASLARPGGNVTGFTVTYPELIGKKLELLKQLIPGLSRVAVIQDDAIPPSARAESTMAMRTAAGSLRLDVKLIDVRSPDDFGAAFREAIQDRRQAPDSSSATARISATCSDVQRGTWIGSSKVRSRVVSPSSGRRSLRSSLTVKTAKALGLTIPASLLLRADHVIE